MKIELSERETSQLMFAVGNAIGAMEAVLIWNEHVDVADGAERLKKIFTEAADMLQSKFDLA